MTSLRTRETDLVHSLLEFLAARRVKAWRNNTGAMRSGGRYVRFNAPGSPDILGFLPPNGRGLAIECKQKGKKATAEQIAFLEDAMRTGALAFVTDDMDEAMLIIDLALKGTT